MSVTELPLIFNFDHFIKASQKGKRIKNATGKFSSGTITQYRCVYKLLEEYEAVTSQALRVQILKKNSVRQLKREKKYWTDFFKKFCSFLYKTKRYFDEYVSLVFKILRTFFNFVRDEKNYDIGNFHRIFRIPLEQSSPITLEPSQLQFLINNRVFEQSLPLSLQRTKDIFVFGCTVGLRYSDLMRLKREHLIDNPGHKYLLIHTKKTGTEVRLPLPEYTLDIVEKYRMKNRTCLLPQLSSTNFNLQVKKLMEHAGWTYFLPKIRYKQGKPVEIRNDKGECLRFCDQVTAHTMRRTAITTLLILGVPELVVRRISGHAANSKEFYKYVVIAQDYLNRNVLQAYEKLLEAA